jgi:hypothetical protein
MAASWYDEALERRARSYDRLQGALFLLRFALLIGLATLFWTSGASRELAEGLRERFAFPYSWPLVHFFFVALSVFGYEVMLFPLTVLADHLMERAQNRRSVEFLRWFRGYLGTLALEIVLVTAGFMGLYLLMRLFPASWWASATALYALLVVGLGEWGPNRLLPKVRPPVAIDDPKLMAELHRLGRLSGVEVDGSAWWDFDHQEDLDDVCLTRVRGQSVMVFSKRAWLGMDREAQLFQAARELSNRGRWVAPKLHAVQILLAAAVFWGAEALADRAALARGLFGAVSLEAFPFLVASLFGLAALAGIALHALERREDLRIDRFALEHAGGREAMRRYFGQEFRREPFGLDAPWWQVWLLRRQPTAARRLAEAERAP